MTLTVLERRTLMHMNSLLQLSRNVYSSDDQSDFKVNRACFRLNKWHARNVLRVSRTHQVVELRRDRLL